MYRLSFSLSALEQFQTQHRSNDSNSRHPAYAPKHGWNQIRPINKAALKPFDETTQNEQPQRSSAGTSRVRKRPACPADRHHRIAGQLSQLLKPPPQPCTCQGERRLQHSSHTRKRLYRITKGFPCRPAPCRYGDTCRRQSCRNQPELMRSRQISFSFKGVDCAVNSLVFQINAPNIFAPYAVPTLHLFFKNSNTTTLYTKSLQF